MSANTAQLQRTTFSTSRLLDFFSKKELEKETGHQASDWPVVILKELMDKALDACEGDNVAPVIAVTVDKFGIAVEDNGPGIPVKTIKGVIDPAKRVSTNEAYVSPTRGAQGNALKTLIGMPFALDNNIGDVAALRLAAF